MPVENTSTLTPTNNTVEDTATIEEMSLEELELEELDEELIIEDFTIDGICGVY